MSNLIVSRTARQRTHSLAWGLALSGCGAAWLLATHGLIPSLSVWLILPALLGSSALIRLALARTPRRALRALLSLALAAWIAAGLLPASPISLGETWPAALLIYFGTACLIRTLPGRRR